MTPKGKFCKQCPCEKEAIGVLSPIIGKQVKVVIIYSRFVAKTAKFSFLLQNQQGWLRTLLGRLGYTLPNAHITSAQKCVITKNTPKYRDDVQKFCGRRLKAEIYRVNPEIVISFGNIPFDYLCTPDQHPSLNSAKILSIKDKEIPWLALQHPSYLRNRPDMIRDMEILLKTIRPQIAAEWSPFYEDIEDDDE